MPAPGQILIVCTANICRSPMAEGLLRHRVKGRDISGAYYTKSQGFHIVELGAVQHAFRVCT